MKTEEIVLIGLAVVMFMMYQASKTKTTAGAAVANNTATGSNNTSVVADSLAAATAGAITDIGGSISDWLTGTTGG